MNSNQIIRNAPEIGDNQRWNVTGYLLGKAVRKCPLKFESFKELDFICRSGDYYHFLAEQKNVIVCTILFKTS